MPLTIRSMLTFPRQKTLWPQLARALAADFCCYLGEGQGTSSQCVLTLGKKRTNKCYSSSWGGLHLWESVGRGQVTVIS